MYMYAGVRIKTRTSQCMIHIVHAVCVCTDLSSFGLLLTYSMSQKKANVLSPLHGTEYSVSSPFRLRVDTVLWKRNAEF